MTRRTLVAPGLPLKSIEQRTALQIARDELTASLVQAGHPETVAIVVRFVDQMQALTDRVLFARGGYSAERFAIGRIATELAEAAERVQTAPLPQLEQELPLPDPDEDLDRFAVRDAEKLALTHKPRSAKWNSRRNKARR